MGGLVAAVVFAPLIEEVVFRGWLQPFWTRAVGGVIGDRSVCRTVCPSPHSGPFAAWPVGGLVLRSLAYVSRSIRLSAGLHVSHNAAAFLLPQVIPVAGLAEAASR